ncbi:MAG TPA: transposase [Bryobacteraceae bacterium]|nr:transposase [Bryobacteraceae bacterium]
MPHPTLHTGDPCPSCEKGKVYPQKDPKTLVRIVGQAPLAATVYELDRLREVFTAPEPEGIGPEKYDETTAAMIALLKYGGGMPFFRLERLEHLLGIPLSASTQWEIVEEAAVAIKAARDELIRRAAQGEVLHNDDTSMRVLRLAREPSDERTGVFTSGIASTKQGQKIALYFTGRQHAGENLRDVLAHRTAELARPIQMCDALSRNAPKLTDSAEILLANCLAHGRRQFVEVAANFPEPCRYVLETLVSGVPLVARCADGSGPRARVERKHAQASSGGAGVGGSSAFPLRNTSSDVLPPTPPRFGESVSSIPPFREATVIERPLAPSRYTSSTWPGRPTQLMRRVFFCRISSVLSQKFVCEIGGEAVPLDRGRRPRRPLLLAGCGKTK